MRLIGDKISVVATNTRRKKQVFYRQTIKLIESGANWSGQGASERERRTGKASTNDGHEPLTGRCSEGQDFAFLPRPLRTNSTVLCDSIIHHRTDNPLPIVSSCLPEAQSCQALRLQIFPGVHSLQSF
jgi:hypothetical protein